MARITMAGLGLLGIGLFLGLDSPALAQSGAKSKARARAGADAGVVAVGPATSSINKHLAAAWQANQLSPAEKCSDHEFIRRASLDIIGRIPRLDEIERFLNDPPSTRRQLLVDRLLASAEYVDNWATLWTHWLMTRTGEPLYRQQMKLWLAEQIEADDFSIRKLAVDLITATGKSNENGAVNYILVHVGAPTVPGNRTDGKVWEKEGQFDMVPVTARTIRIFLGYQLQCTQCHCHPFNADWKQKHFWGMNAFFRQVERIGDPRPRDQMGMTPAQLILRDNPDFNKTGLVFFEKRNGVFLPSDIQFLDGGKIAKGANRRTELAKFIVGHKNFSRAYVNRMWDHFFGRGLNVQASFDDFGEHNEVVHEELLGELADAFTKADYNPRQLIRWITASEAYQLRAVANRTNDRPEHEVYMSRMLAKPMSPEQLLESLIVAARPNAPAADAARFRADWMARLLINFGDDEGNEGNFSGTVRQALDLMNGQDINQAIRTSSTVQRALQFEKGKEAMDHLFLATYSRPATDQEYRQIVERLPLKVKESDEAGRLQDVFWALLNSGEFFYNH
jgi:hypothetical protein